MGLPWRALDELPVDEQAEVLGYYEATTQQQQGGNNAARGIPTQATKESRV